MSDGKNALRPIAGGSGDEVDASQHGVDSSGVVPKGESEQALLLAGKISVEDYMEMTVDRTLSHLRGQISGQRFSLMRDVLRKELEQDPHLSALVARVAAGN